MRDLTVLNLEAQFDAEQPLRVLIAEDEPTQRLLLEQLLVRGGYHVDVTADGVEAFEHIRQGDYAMLVTDWNMPGLNGAALCREIRCAGIPHYLYILILTGHDTGADVVSALDAGADDYVRKSAVPTELLARLAAGARIVRLERSLRAAQARIELLSVTDPLLPLYNRRYLAAELEREIERSNRYRHALSVVIADIDHFKLVNDSHGHLIGDEVLLAFASLITTPLRVSDWAARYGGEEFVLVLPETSLDGAMAVAEKLRLAIEASRIPLSSGIEVPITASFGVATLQPGTPSARAAIDPLLQAADAALYRSKAGGRNRVSAA